MGEEVEVALGAEQKGAGPMWAGVDKGRSPTVWAGLEVGGAEMGGVRDNWGARGVASERAGGHGLKGRGERGGFQHQSQPAPLPRKGYKTPER